MRTFAAIVVALTFPTFCAGDEFPDFSKLGQRFVERHCLRCHNTETQEGELTLADARDSQAVVRSRKVFETALKRILAGEMPPEDEPRPTPDEIREFTAHVKAIWDYADRHAEPDPGRVTMRRLNKTEYRNTIRDLIGVDFDPTVDFPSDDVGHGFDNIGDVLTLPPVLMERYLAAAESIVERAIVVNPPDPVKRHLAARYTEPASADVEAKVLENGWRRMSSDGAEAIETGPVHTRYEWQDGEYIFRTKVYAKSEGSVPIAIVLSGRRLEDLSPEEEINGLVAIPYGRGKILKRFDVTAHSPEDAQLIEVKVPDLSGRSRLMVALAKPKDGAPATSVLVEHLALEGPLDSRPASQRELLKANPDASQAEQTREVLTRFLKRAYRRPATPEEVERLAGLVDATVADGSSWEAGMQLAVQAVLCSPKFLFRVELDDRPTSPQPRPLDEYQLASRLSYFLWSSMPDDELLTLADQGQLAENLDTQVKRMLADPKSRALVDNFAIQWLQIGRINQLAPDREMFPAFDDDLRTSMLQETVLFFDSIIREDRSILDLIDADYTFLNGPLARLYGIADTNGNPAGQEAKQPGGEVLRDEEFKRVSLQDRTRGGLLTQASVLTVTSNPNRTSPVKRGRWVLEQILGEPPPPPPPNVPELSEEKEATSAASLRERLEIHRQNPSCANCHEKMDPIGFALENYNAIGGFRTKDGEFPIDSSGEFADGTKFSGPGDLKSIVRDKREEFTRCLTEKMLIYALGRGVEYYDRPTVEQIVQSLAENEYRFSVLVQEIAKSDPFRYRRGTEPMPEQGDPEGESSEN
ncbi:MAG: DUF1592 domain-containing protein [Planctomycetaceae bacterium]|nr:DUF1592 domain-containing protein [Planctomycetaceae bacterium]